MDKALSSLLRTAATLGESVAQSAPTDRPVDVDELKLVEDKVVAEVIREYRENAGIGVDAGALVEPMLAAAETKFRAAFAKSFYANLPLSTMQNQGRA